MGFLNRNRAPSTTRPALRKNHEHRTRHARRLGRPQIYCSRPQRSRPLSMVLPGSPSLALHLLLRILRSRVEAPLSAWLPA